MLNASSRTLIILSMFSLLNGCAGIGAGAVFSSAASGMFWGQMFRSDSDKASLTQTYTKADEVYVQLTTFVAIECPCRKNDSNGNGWSSSNAYLKCVTSAIDRWFVSNEQNDDLKEQVLKENYSRDCGGESYILINQQNND